MEKKKKKKKIGGCVYGGLGFWFELWVCDFYRAAGLATEGLFG